MRSDRDASLDGLRGIAAFCVVLSHVAAMTWVPFEEKTPAPHVWNYLLWHLGAPAVDVFFVLSGYVVAKSFHRRPTGYLPYLLGRYVRLLPMAWIGVCVGMLLKLLVTYYPHGMTGMTRFLLEPLSMKDIAGFTTMTYPVASIDRVNPVLWTMFVELQASLMLPIAAVLARRSLPAYAFVVICLMIGVLLLAGNFYPVYFVGFAIGIAYASGEKTLPPLPKPLFALAVGTVILLIRHWTASDSELYRPVGALGAIVMIVAIRQGAGRALLEHPVSRWLGGVSYPLYATHAPIMFLSCAMLAGTLGITGAAVASIPVSLVLASGLRTAIDRPATRLSRLVKR